MEPTQRFDISTPDALRQFLAFAAEGVRHIWKGIDHILFLLSLLLPSVLRREKGEWRVVDDFRPAFFNVFKIVTAFTRRPRCDSDPGNPATGRIAFACG